MKSTQHLNPFDNEAFNFLVLQNQHGQYSLWPEFAAIPNGWQTIIGPMSRAECIDYVEQHWTAINPFKHSVLEG
ncbi:MULTISPECIES: MbtH family protein [Marinomonas]|uniref:MbtH family protein n=1 Tax=Marinomonas rhodophyticola TaxID=2992803 RepID=A0ABT3KH66_9GAMM|nr:MbtH family protein [Marinomonas sp. KJ51-3]MCW4629855.1 MbtH family protein [Marinomonas sp. KJ51-3]